MLHMNGKLRCFLQTDSHRKEETRSRKRFLGSARDDDTREWTLSHSLSYRCGANLRPFGAPPSKGRRWNTHYPPHHSLPRVGKVTSIASRIGFQGNVREQLSQVSDLREYPSAAHLTFPFISSRRGCPCGADLSSTFGAPLLQGAAQRSCKKADPSQGLLPHIVISSVARNLPCTTVKRRM